MIRNLKNYQYSTEGEKFHKNVALVLVIISENSLVFFLGKLLPLLVFAGTAPQGISTSTGKKWVSQWLASVALHWHSKVAVLCKVHWIIHDPVTGTLSQRQTMELNRTQPPCVSQLHTSLDHFSHGPSLRDTWQEESEFIGLALRRKGWVSHQWLTRCRVALTLKRLFLRCAILLSTPCFRFVASVVQWRSSCLWVSRVSAMASESWFWQARFKVRSPSHLAQNYSSSTFSAISILAAHIRFQASASGAGWAPCPKQKQPAGVTSFLSILKLLLVRILITNLRLHLVSFPSTDASFCLVETLLLTSVLV